MGCILQRTAVSTNIKERLDYSCAMFDSEGGLVANAPHIPVIKKGFKSHTRSRVRLLW
jgi:5-oxoprolinase (ATP-hydrolysing)